MKRDFSFSPEPVPNQLQGKWVRRYTGQSQSKDLQQVIKDVLKVASEEGNCSILAGVAATWKG